MSRWRIAIGMVLLVAGVAAARLVVFAVVTGDSMAPAIVRGDVCVVARSGDVVPGDVVLYRDPCARRPVLHRVVALNGDGSLTTQGDANESADRRTVPRAAVVGRVVRVMSFGRTLRLASGP